MEFDSDMFKNGKDGERFHYCSDEEDLKVAIAASATILHGLILHRQDQAGISHTGLKRLLVDEKKRKGHHQEDFLIGLDMGFDAAASRSRARAVVQ